MSQQSSRREFLRTTALSGMGVWVATSSWAQGRSPNETINFACIGVGGKGEGDSDHVGQLGNVVAICDVDENTLNRAGERFPKAKKYNDYRRMLDEMGKSIDAVTVSTPDHHHALAAAHAMHLGKHVYCQKPLTHSIYEARYLGKLARDKKVVTQMGNQGTATDGLRRNAAIVRAGAIGTPKEVHVWTNRPIWPQGCDRPDPAPVPPNLHWDLWIGPAPDRPYGNGYHPFAWRGFWDFGTGALGDMACHTVNLPYMALDLKYPTSVVAQSSGTNKDSYPTWSIIKFQFPATEHRPALTMTWYDGGKRPPQDLVEGQSFSDSGSLMIGDKGKFYSPNDYGEEGHLIGGIDPGDVKITTVPGRTGDSDLDQKRDWVYAIKNGGQATSNFPDYAGPLVETILLGNLAVWAEGKEIQWDAKHLRASNAPEVEHIIKPVYQHGYSLG